MPGRAVVLGRVLVLRRVATPDMAADLAEPQVNPRVAHLQTFLAALRLWSRIPDQLEMRTDLRDGHRCSLLPLSGCGCQLVGSLKLPVIQSRIESPLLKQVRVAPLLAHLAVINHQDDVGG